LLEQQEILTPFSQLQAFIMLLLPEVFSILRLSFLRGALLAIFPILPIQFYFQVPHFILSPPFSVILLDPVA